MCAVRPDQTSNATFVVSFNLLGHDVVCAKIHTGMSGWVGGKRKLCPVCCKDAIRAAEIARFACFKETRSLARSLDVCALVQ